MWTPAGPGLIRCESCETTFRTASDGCDCPTSRELLAEVDGEDAATSYDHPDDLAEIQERLIALSNDVAKQRRGLGRAQKAGLSRARAVAALADVERKLLLGRADLAVKREELRVVEEAEAEARRIRELRERVAH